MATIDWLHATRAAMVGRRRLAGWVWGAVLVAVGGCAADRAERVELHTPGGGNDNSVVIFFVDGVNRERLGEMVRAGELPNIERHFVRGGVEVEHAVTGLPPITYAISTSLITGRFPGHHGVMGNQWFDPVAFAGADYGSALTYRTVNDHFTCPTIYDVLADRLTVNVQGHTRRGVTRTIDNWVTAGLEWGRGDYSAVDRRVGRCIAEVVAAARAEGRWPAVLMNYFPGVDEIGHRWGSNSPQYAEALRVVDEAVGRIIAAVNAVRPADATYFVLVSDHGHVRTAPGQVFDVADWLSRARGLRVRRGPLTGGASAVRRALDRYDAVVLDDGNRRAAVHLRGPDGWGTRPTAEQVGAVVGEAGDGLEDQPSVELVCRRDGQDRVAVLSRRGCAIVERRRGAGEAYYRLSSEGEAAGTATGRLVLDLPAGFDPAEWRSSRAWLAATAGTRYPDFVPQVVEMFDSPRAGDIVVFAEEEGAFADRDRGGHGSALAADMLVPLFFAGPGLAGGARIDHARVVDIMPTVLDLLGEAGRLATVEPIDGVSIAAELKAAAERGSSE